MSVYQITYTLRKPGQNYDDLYDAIEALGDSVHALDDCWFVETDDTASDIRDDLKAYVSSNDSIIVTKKSTTGVTWATSSAGEAAAWLKDH